MTGLGPSRTVTRYDADSPEADIDWPIDEMNPEIPERDDADASAGHDTFVAHQWGRKETPAKRIRTPRHATNVTKLGNVYAVSGDDEEAAVNEVAQEATASDKEEVAPETYKQAVLDPKWRESMKTEVRALRNRGCWRVVPTPSGVRLIKSKYVYKLKKDWREVVSKRKSRLVCQGFLQRKGIDFNET